MENKWIRAAIPALLIHVSVGTVYCWSTVKEQIAYKIGMSQFAVGWAFSLAIFFLGMFAGKFVEIDIHKSSLISCLCFTVGMIGTGMVAKFMTGVPALIGIYVFYGVIMGIGLGIGYLSPVKTLMLWFHENKGLATGISIMGFGLAKAIATPIMQALQDNIGIGNTFVVLGEFYFVLMFIGHRLLKKPEGWVESHIESKESLLDMIRNKEFAGIWLMFYINIHCGLMIISYEKQILNSAFITSTALPMLIVLIPSLSATFNALGRIGYSTLSDKLRQRNTIYKIIFASSSFISIIAYVSKATLGAYNTILSAIVVIFLLTVNAGYGGGFSTLPALLSERFGMKRISQIHGLALSAWAVAGLTGNNLSEIVLRHTGNYQTVIFIGAALYMLAFGICAVVVGNKGEN